MAVETRTVAADDNDIRLDRWFKRHYPELSHIILQKLLRKGEVRLDGKRAEASDRVSTGQAVRVPPLPKPLPAGERPKPKPVVATEDDRRRLKDMLLYEDDQILVLNKPAGLAVQGGSGMGGNHLDALLTAIYPAESRPRLVHRLDKDTSGVLVMGKSPAAAAKLAEAFRTRESAKTYLAVTVNAPKIHQGRIDIPLAKEAGPQGERMAENDEDGRRAVTLYQTLDTMSRSAALLALRPVTGRTHQLRVHCAGIGCPILGDFKYGGAESFLPNLQLSRQLHLHAWRLAIPHPNGKLIRAEAPLPPHFRAALDALSLDLPRGPLDFDE